ncbi:MerR family DNA-binding transcriptional regulator, partial [Nocardia wallacei]|uniref:MerR family DNA-binding transcriptional regulator n=1 Tax=Nocardia wallacei TaxID=480035 RepID=UPI002453F97F
MREAEFTVESLAARAGVPTSTVRMYQTKGLLHAPRRGGGGGRGAPPPAPPPAGGGGQPPVGLQHPPGGGGAACRGGQALDGELGL